MHTTEAADKKLNRRVAFRVYEQANLFYVKMDRRQVIDSELGLDNILTDVVNSPSTGRSSTEDSLPSSHSQENDTLNVNISTSGIAFTCKDELKPGDYLMLRILLLSNMTVIMTCCKVVYCKSSNPYETNRYPFSIGARFVNMTAEDNALLKKHISRIRKQQFIINGSIAALLMAILAAPDQALTVLESLGHHLLELVLHLLHLGFEYLEMGLDHIIEHTFHTGMRETQLIVFYILLTFALIILYFLGRKVPAACIRLNNRLRLFWSRKKSSCLYFWEQQSLPDKFKIIGISTVAIAGYIYLTV